MKGHVKTIEDNGKLIDYATGLHDDSGEVLEPITEDDLIALPKINKEYDENGRRYE